MTRLELRTPITLLGLLATAEVVAVAVLAAARPNGGTGAVVVALVLAPVALWSVVAISERIAGTSFAVGAAVVYVLLPFVARLFFYGSFVAIAPPRATGAVGVIALIAGLVAWGDTDWTTLYDNFHETAWSPTLLSLLPFACVLAVGLRRPWIAAALGGWIGFFILHGVQRSYPTGAFWLSLAATTPAAAVLLTSLALLVPRLGSAKAPAPQAGSPREAR